MSDRLRAWQRRFCERPAPPERHPIGSDPGASLERRLATLEEYVAELWDEVWWHQLPWYRRLAYWCQGFRSPIARFYEPR